MKVKCISNIPTLGGFGVSNYITPGKVYECDYLGCGFARIESDEGNRIITISYGDDAHGEWEVVKE